jgi:chitodextrinase
VPRHWQVLLMAALGIGATVVAVPRALSGIVAVPQVVEAGISRTAPVTPSTKPSTAKMPVWSAPVTTARAATPDTRPPSAVSGLRLLANTEANISLAWDAGQDNVAVKLYLIRGDGFPTIQTTDTRATVAWPRRTANVLLQVCVVDTSGNQGEWRNLLVTAPLGAAAATSAAPTTAPATTVNPVVTTAPSDTSTPTTVTATTPPTGATPLAAVREPATADASAAPSSA